MAQLVKIEVFVADDGTRVTKVKLVRIYPDRLSWTNTHISGPNRHSQFLYEIVAEGASACRLDFTGLQVLEVETGTRQELAAVARTLREEDAAIWKNLARALASEMRR